MGQDQTNALSMWVIYDHPTDYPDFFIVREHMITAGGQVLKSLFHTEFMTLEDARTEIRPGRICIPRDPNDDPVIVESWV